jgi:hypothetical protein
MLEAKPQLDDVTARSFVVEALDRLFVEEYDVLGVGSERAVSAQFECGFEGAASSRRDACRGRA